MSLATSSHGVTIEFQPTPGGSFLTIGELGDTAPPGLSREEHDSTTHDDDIDSYILGVLRRESLEFPINLLNANAAHSAAAGLQKMIIDNVKTGFRFTYPDATVWIFSGGVSKFMPKTPVDGVLTADVTVRPTGPMILDGVTVD
jgi:hypothetical protein